MSSAFSAGWSRMDTRHLAPDAGVRVAGEPRGHRHDVETRAPHRPVGRDAQRRIGVRLGRSRALTALGTELIQEVDRPAAHVGAGIVEQRGDGVHRGRATRFQPFEADRPHVHRGRSQRRDQAVDRRGVERRDLRHEALRSDPVNRPRQRVVQVLVPSDPRVDPVADIQRAVGTDGDV